MLEVKNIKTGKTYYGIISEDKETVKLFNHSDGSGKSDIIVTRKEVIQEYEPVNQ
jgi:hypothetical protein